MNWTDTIKILQKYCSTNDVWDYITALRGPDVDSESYHYKMILTAPLRGEAPTICIDIEDTKILLEESNRENIVGNLILKISEIPLHYLMHTRNGYHSIHYVTGLKSTYKMWRTLDKIILMKRKLPFSYHVANINLNELVITIEEYIDDTIGKTPESLRSEYFKEEE